MLRSTEEREEYGRCQSLVVDYPATQTTTWKRPINHTQENAMKYMLLIYSDEQGWTDSERQDCFNESVALTHTLKKEGKYLAASPLHSVTTATSVRVRGGKKQVTDGPFAE